MGKVFQAEETACAKPGNESNYRLIRMVGRWGDVQTLEEELQSKQRPDVPGFRCHAQRSGFCPVGHKESWDVFSDRIGWGENEGREAS